MIDAVALWTGRVLLVFWAGVFLVLLAAVVRVYGARCLQRVRDRSRRRVAHARLTRTFASCDQALATHEDAGDVNDCIPEGLGYPTVRDGALVDLRQLHPNDQDVFGHARRPQ